MEYITARETAAKWGVTLRQVQTLCDRGRIPGAIRFNRCWAIPSDAQKPADGRSKAPLEKAGALLPIEPSGERDCSIFRFAMFFPYPMQIMAPDGTVLLFNDALKKMFRISDAAADKLIGRYNMLKYPMMEKWGLKDDIARLFQGEPVQWKDMRVPLQEISNLFGEGELTTETIYQDIFGFSIYDDLHRMTFVVIVYITSRLYSGKEEITKGREYLENHWQTEFDLDAAAKASGLSRGHFEKLFKTHTGFTPHQYYLDIKIRMLQRKLVDSNLSVSRAFKECGMEYNSYYVGVFKERTGMAPIEYRKGAGGRNPLKGRS
jgi:AraC family transcriptional regulator